MHDDHDQTPPVLLEAAAPPSRYTETEETPCCITLVNPVTATGCEGTEEAAVAAVAAAAATATAFVETTAGDGSGCGTTATPAGGAAAGPGAEAPDGNGC